MRPVSNRLGVHGGSIMGYCGSARLRQCHRGFRTAPVGQEETAAAFELFVNGTLMRGLELHGNLEGTEFWERHRLLRYIAPSSLLVSRRNWIGAIEIGSGLLRLNRNASTSLPSRAAVAVA